MARSPWPHMTVNGSSGKLGGGDGAELDVAGAGNVPGGVLVGLADIDDSAVHGGRLDHGDGGDRASAGAPGVDPAGQLADEPFVADVEALADQLVPVLVVVEDEHERPVRLDEPAEPAAKRRSQRVGQRAGEVPGGERGDRADIDDHATRREVALDVVGAEPVEAGQCVVAAGSEPVQLGKPGEVGGEGAEPGEEPRDELVLIRDAEQWVRDPLTTERAGALRGAGRGAERPGAVGRVDGDVVGKLVVAAQRVEHLAGQRLGPLGAAQIGPSDRADHQRPTGEHRHRPAGAMQDVGVVVRRVPGRRYRLQRDGVGQLDRVAVGDGTVRYGQPRRGRGDEHRIRAGRQRGAAGHVVGVGMRIQVHATRSPELRAACS